MDLTGVRVGGGDVDGAPGSVGLTGGTGDGVGGSVGHTGV